MPHFFIVLLKINIVLLLFGATYYLILRRLTFYTLNRLFLAFGILFATIYPFIDLTEFFLARQNDAIAFVPQLNEKASELVPAAFIQINWQLLSILFYLGVAFMAFRLMVQFISLYRMHQKSKPGYVANHQVRILDEPVSPFSFWQTVYINPALHKKTELDTILAHEAVHVKQWHSLDIILAELSVVFYWFNPGVWLMKKAVKENLEFITDQKILNKGVDRKVYQYSLLDVGNLTPAVEIVNNFNLSDLKKRIKMMNSKRSSKFTLSRYLLALPVLLLTTLAFTVSKKEIKESFAPINKFVAEVTDAKEEIKQPVAVVVSKKKPIKQALKKANKPNELEIEVIGGQTMALKPDSVLTIVKRLESAAIIDDDLSNRVKGRVAGLLIKRDTAVVNHVQFKYTGKPSEVNNTVLKTVVVRGFSTKKQADSAQLLKNVKLMFEGKAISRDEFNKLDANQIEAISVVKGATGVGTISISTKKQN
ncbi:MAG: M56 family metallopeptidase [Flavobacterium sp.]|nr:MAG: M56 family metallopeptidase [Flavobacterium sp.]